MQPGNCNARLGRSEPVHRSASAGNQELEHDVGKYSDLDITNRESAAADPHSRRLGVRVGRHPEVPVSGAARRGALREDRDSRAACHGAIVGTVEIVCGTLVLVGLFTRLASVPLLGVITVAIATTKIPMIAKSGMWSMLHEARADCSMLLGLVFLLIAGAGTLSLDVLRRDR